MPNVPVGRWTMSAAEEDFLAALPEVVDLYLAESEEGDAHYLTDASGIAGARAYAYSSGSAQLRRVVVAREEILAIDLDRDRAQLRERGDRCT